MMISGYDITSTNGVVHVMGLAEMIADGLTGPVYDDLLAQVEETSSSLANLRKQLTLIEIELEDENSMLAVDLQIIQAEIESHNEELSILLDSLPPVTGSAYEVSLRELRAAYDRTSVALSDARKELRLLDIEGKSVEMESIELDYRMAQAKVDNLYMELATINDTLSSLLVGEVTSTEIENLLAIGVPEMPTPVVSLRLRDVLIVGGLIGAVLTWLILNRKWVIRGLFQSGSKSSEKEDEE
jgi:hypothetical protein